MTPLVLQRKEEGRTIPVPCGKCPACLKRRTSNWSFRLMQEYKVSDSAHFITLTYDTNFVPITKNRYMSLDRPRRRLGTITRGKNKGKTGWISVSSDLQLFFKALRRIQFGWFRPAPFRHHQWYGNKRSYLYFGKPIKYFAVGEYGTGRCRPHYHIILFNASPKCVELAWTKGYIHFGQVSEASVGYTLKYMQKPTKIPLHAKDDRVPEYQLMSKGLGLSYVSEKMVKWHKASLLERMYCNTSDGKKISMPRYYKDRVYTLEERSCVSGYNKGRIEQDGDRRAACSTPEDERKRAERIKQDFTNMHLKSTQGRKI